MVVVAEFEISADEFALGRVLTAGLDVVVDVERVVPASDRRLPYHWVEGTDAARFADRVAAADAVESVAELDRVGERTLYRIDWDAAFDPFGPAFADGRGTILSARGNDCWRLRLRFPSRAALSAFHRRCEDCGTSLSLVRVQSTADDDVDRFGLTPEQRRVLELAVERGYFSIPRECTLSEVAADLGISTQAASERLRRGADAVLRSELLETGPQSGRRYERRGARDR